jgi:hypothetical protein
VHGALQFETSLREPPTVAPQKHSPEYSSPAYLKSFPIFLLVGSTTGFGTRLTFAEINASVDGHIIIIKFGSVFQSIGASSIREAAGINEWSSWCASWERNSPPLDNTSIGNLSQTSSQSNTCNECLECCHSEKR